MRNIAIYGAGGFGREIACLIREINENTVGSKLNLIGFIDDGKAIGSSNEYGKIIGNLEFLNSYQNELDVVLSIGSPQTVSKIVSKITNPLISFPNIIAPDIRYLDKSSLVLGQGNIFFSKCSLSCNVKIGNFNIFNSSIAIGHDAVIKDYNAFMPGTKISGEVVVGNMNFFGINSVVLQRVRIGSKTVIGAGSIVIRKTQDNSTYWGNPATRL